MFNKMKKNWYISCSPRSPEKIQPELKALKKYEGMIWEGRHGRQNQENFANDLKNLDSFKGETFETETSFSARDRVAPMKTFGFVYVDKEKKLRFTPAGNALIENIRPKEIFLRQFLKWQYPSFQHSAPSQYPTSFWNFNPFKSFVMLVDTLEYITEEEIKIFYMTMFNNKLIFRLAKEILDFRNSFKNISTISKEEQKEKYIFERFKHIYGDITFVREGKTESCGTEAIKTKIRNSKDMADAVVRYFLYTGIFVTRGLKIYLNPEKKELIDEILKSFKNENNKDYLDVEKFHKYFGNHSLPSFTTDCPEKIKNEILDLISKNYAFIAEIEKHFPNVLDEKKRLSVFNDYLSSPSKSIEDLKNILYFVQELNLELKKKKLQIKFENVNEAKKIILSLESYYSIPKLKEITKDYIANKNTLLEYFTFNGMIILGGALSYQNNFTTDEELNPISHASGNQADMEIFYKDFIALVEVTTSKSSTQFKMEKEPVTRHYLTKKDALNNSKDSRDLFCIFIAPHLDDNTFLEFAKYNTLFGTKIIPLSLNQFIKILILKLKARSFSETVLLEILNELLKITISNSLNVTSIKNSIASYFESKEFYDI